MDRFIAMLMLLGTLVSLVLLVLALFAVAPITCSCVVSLLYSLYLFMAFEESGGGSSGKVPGSTKRSAAVQPGPEQEEEPDQFYYGVGEMENRFWTIFALLLSTALFFAKDSPLAFLADWSPGLGLLAVLISGYAMHVWCRHVHRQAMSQHPLPGMLITARNSIMGASGSPNNGSNSSPTSSTNSLRSRIWNTSPSNSGSSLRSSSSLQRLRELGIPVEEQLSKINSCLQDIDQLLIPSTINNFINQRFILSKEREIISVFEECDSRALNYLIGHVQLGLLFYKVKDHRNFNGKHRTDLIQLLAVERLSILSVVSRVIVLHSLQLLKLRANPRAEYWVRNIILNTHQDELSELKTLTDAKGDYFCMNKLIYDDIRSETVRQDILNHIRREAAVLQTHMQMGAHHYEQHQRRKNQRKQLQQRRRSLPRMQWRKVLSDVDDTLCSSGGMYPAGVDKRYAKKTVYPGVLAFYRELDLGTQGPAEWQDDRVGNLVFLSARPHVYKDVSERANYAKFEKLRAPSVDGRKGMHTTPSLLPGDLASGSSYIVTNDFEPLARKKFDNFRRYASIYPEYQHVFVCDNGQGDVRAGEMMFDSFPYVFESLFVHVVQDLSKTYGYKPERWKDKQFRPCFFRTYPEAALHAVARDPPLILMEGLRRICVDTVKDFALIRSWPSEFVKAERRLELNQALWTANHVLEWNGMEPVEQIKAEQRWQIGQKVRTPYGIARVRAFDPLWDMYEVELDWRPLDVQVAEDQEEVKKAKIRPRPGTPSSRGTPSLATVEEIDESVEEMQPIVEEEEPPPEEEAERQLAEEEEQPSLEPIIVDSIEQEVGEPSEERRERRSTDSTSSGKAASVSNDTDMEDNTSPSERLSPPPPSLSPSETSLPSLDVPGSPSRKAGDEKPESPTRESQGVSVESKSSSPVIAYLSGRFVTKYTPPVLPKFDKQQRGSLFPFLGPGAEAGFKEGDKCVTPYGPGRVVEVRSKQGDVVVDMAGWKARAYLRQDTVKPVSNSLFRSFLRQFSGAESSQTKPLDFPYATGTEIKTPFGVGTVTRPLPLQKPRPETDLAPKTIGISLHSWKLADSTHPMLYCTVETARAWKDGKAGDSSSILSALGSLVTSSKSLLLEPFRSHKPETPAPPPKFERYFADAAAVTTTYGDGVVAGFRETDGIYEVSLTQWTLSDGTHPKAFLRRQSINHRVAKGCQEGYPVLTSLGLTGVLASVEPTTGVHIVTVPSAGMVCYLQPECVVRPLKAAVNEDVLTPYGEGKVERYDAARDMYTIVLDGWNARLYAKGDTFDRVGEGVQDRDGPFGVNWVLQFFFSGRKQRGRSESVSTRSINGSQSNRSDR